MPLAIPLNLIRVKKLNLFIYVQAQIDLHILKPTRRLRTTPKLSMMASGWTRLKPVKARHLPVIMPQKRELSTPRTRVHQLLAQVSGEQRACQLRLAT